MSREPRKTESAVSRRHWRPAASMRAMQVRAESLQVIRDYFRQSGVLEVETPVCSASAVTDPVLDSFRTRYTGPDAPEGMGMYLQTSPESAMKRLLAAGSGPIYQICKAFRNGERGRLHNPEFTILEWYRPGYDHHRLTDDVESLVCLLLDSPRPFERIGYREAFRRTLDIDPHRAGVAELKACAGARGMEGVDSLHLEEADAWLDLLMSRFVEPELGVNAPCFVYDYPASKASLARIRAGDPPVAERFELYRSGVELANGFYELRDAAEQRRRFERDLQQRRCAAKEALPMDEYLLGALEDGIE